jgi:hypothetical protein
VRQHRQSPVVLEHDLTQAILQALFHLKGNSYALAAGTAAQHPFSPANLHLKVSTVLPTGFHSLHCVID